MKTHFTTLRLQAGGVESRGKIKGFHPYPAKRFLPPIKITFSEVCPYGH
ncbi:MAG: hypothetical protein WCY98_05160 [Castellaniella sp.]